MTTPVAWLSALIGLAAASPPSAVSALQAESQTEIPTEIELQTERAAERRFLSAEQFYAGGRHAQAIRDFEAILETMPSSRLADDAALRIARHRFEVEADPAAAAAMVDRLFRAYPAGDSVPGGHLLLARIAASSIPPRPDDALAEFERTLTASGPAGSPWSFEALIGIAAIASDSMDDRTAAGALLSALHETRSKASPVERFEARLLLARTLARLGETDAALVAAARLRADLLRAIRSESPGAAPDAADAGIALDSAPGGRQDGANAALAAAARDLARLITRYRNPGGPAWRFAGAIQPPRRLDRPLRVRSAGGRLHVLDRDADELQTFLPDGTFEGAFGVDDSRDVAFIEMPAGVSLPVIAADEALVVGGNVQTLTGGSRGERLRRLRAIAPTPEGYWVWDDREKGVLRFARSGQFLGTVPHPRLDEVRRIARHPAGHLVVVEERQGVLAFDAEGRRIFQLTRESDLPRVVDVAFDDLGRLFVLDREGPGLGVFDPEFASLALFRGGDWSDGAVRRPVSLDVGPGGELYVLDDAIRAVVVLR